MEISLADLKELGSVGFPGLLGIEFVEPGDGYMRARLAIEEKHMAPNGYLHAGTVVGFADSVAGYGCVLNLPGRRDRLHDDRAEDELPRQRARAGRSSARRAWCTAAGRRSCGTRP